MLCWSDGVVCMTETHVNHTVFDWFRTPAVPGAAPVADQEVDEDEWARVVEVFELEVVN